jgi:4-amino-4-deoxy-L-arabinose transferase-like glycosyltransferase
VSRAALVLAVGAVAIAALTLRLVGTEWGKPYAYHFDEPFILKPALRIVDEGDLNPHFFRYPSLMIYVEAAIAAGNHVFGDMPLAVPEGAAYGPSDLGTWTWPALAGGRHTVAVLGTVAVVLGAVVAYATGGAVAALLAAVLLAVLPLHVEHSHYLTTDVPAATLLLAAFAVLARASSPLRAAAWAGAAAGLAIATKYTMAAALPALVLLCVLSARGSFGSNLACIAALLAACVAAFVAACPYAVLDTHTFLAEINVVREHYGGGHLGAEGAANWRWYLARLRTDGLGDAGLAVFAVGAAGVAYDLVRAGAFTEP